MSDEFGGVDGEVEGTVGSVFASFSVDEEGVSVG